MRNTLVLLVVCTISLNLFSQPVPPEGKKWVPVEELSDEFNQESLDTEKWNDYHPGWAGRTPSNFLRENVWVSDGMLHLRSNSRVKSMDEVKDSIRDVWVNSAAVSSVKRLAEPGWYYETKMKASDISMTNSFWFRMGDYSEIDVIEHMGHATNPDRPLTEFLYACNTHAYGSKRQEGYSLGAHHYMATRGRDEFHVYGLWWKDPNTLWFYHNGVKVMEVTPSVPFEENLHMIWDTEVFRWHGLPTIEGLQDNSRNTMYVDFVRTFKLEDIKRPDKGKTNIVN
ncbi:family 16 glycosylhydrolase [Bacteroidota bacterium]